MKKFSKFCPIAALVLVGNLFMGCHSDIDFTNIDPTAEVQFGLSLPVGSLHMSVGDILGTGAGNFYVDSLNNKGVLTWKDTFSVSRSFTKMDLAQYISEKDISLRVYEKFPTIPDIPGFGKTIPGTGIPITIDFDMPLKLTGINAPENVGTHRLDSALILNASFSSTISTVNLPIAWSWIDNVTLELGDQIRRPQGNKMVVYDKSWNKYGWGTKIPTAVDNFTLDLTDIMNPGQIIDSCNFHIYFTFTIPIGSSVKIDETSGFDYHLGVQFIDYTAIWGRFKPSKDMTGESVFDLSNSWEQLRFISRAKVPFADPRIDMHIVTRLAGALIMQGDYLYAEDKNGVKHYALFTDENGKTHQDFHRQFNSSEYLDPKTSAIGDSTTNMVVPFSNKPSEGHIELLFKETPQRLGYKFGVDFNYDSTENIRIINNNDIRIDAVTTLPMIFSEGVYVNHKDTFTDINLSQFSVDSLLKEAKIRSSNMKALLHVENTMPVDIKAVIRCLKADGKVVMDPKDNTKPFLLAKADTLLFQAPTYAKKNNTWTVIAPGESDIILEVSKEEIDLFPTIDKIEYEVIIDDKSLAEAYKNGLTNIRLSKDQGLTIKIGLTAEVDALLNYFKNN